MPESKPIYPPLREYLDEQAEKAPNLAEMPDPQRVEAARAAMPHALKARDVIPGLPNAVRHRDLTVGEGRPARLYTPERPAEGQNSRPLLVYLHGGGWVAGSLATHDPFCCLLSEAADLLILSVDYRQPPEHRFPAALEDTVAAVRWAAKHAGELGADPDRIAVGGDSAGGNLTAAAVNRLAAGSDGPSVAAQLLLCPVTAAPDADLPSHKENATGYGLTEEGMRWYWRQYAPTVGPDDPDAYPLRRDPLPTLPPTLVVTAGYDYLRDEGIAYADKLRAAEVAVTHLHAPEMNHNFPVHPGTIARFPQSVTMLNEIAGWLRAQLGNPLPASLEARSR